MIFIKQKQNYKKSSGFTLVEVMVALFVLTIGILSISMVLPYANKQLINGEQSTQASFLAQSKIEEMISTPYEDLNVGQVTENSLPANFSKFIRQTIISYVDNNFNSTTTDSGLKKIVVTITNLNNPSFSYQLITAQTKH